MPSIALSAQVALALALASQPQIGAATSGHAILIERMLQRAQVALGRWYAFLGTKTPMDLEPWSTTLLTLASLTRSPSAQGMAGGGVPALWHAAFDARGGPNLAAVADPSRRGQAVAMSTFAAFQGDPALGHIEAQHIYERRRADGTIDAASASDASIQALYAIGLAREALVLDHLPM
jgi:hypothetical protein